MTTQRIQLPQADRLSLIVALLEAVSRGVSGITPLSQALSVTPRQVHYYAHAASFLGLLEGEEGRFSLTRPGRRVLDADPDRRFETIVGFALAHPALADLLSPLAEEPEIDGRAISKAIEGAGYGAATAERRAQTLVGWFRQAGLELSQSLRAGCPVRDQLSIFDASGSPPLSQEVGAKAEAPDRLAPESTPDRTEPEPVPAAPGPSASAGDHQGPALPTAGARGVALAPPSADPVVGSEPVREGRPEPIEALAGVGPPLSPPSGPPAGGESAPAPRPGAEDRSPRSPELPLGLPLRAKTPVLPPRGRGERSPRERPILLA
jgi:hypothetical protein